LWVLSAGESGSPADRRYAGLALIGLSGASQEMLARAQQMTPIAAVQNRFHLLDRSGVQVLADCEAQGIMFVPHFPLAWLLRRSPAMVVIPGTANPAVDGLAEQVQRIFARRMAAEATTSVRAQSE
jgi:aryl-alcohol dehydrogenase-like predicted oxidoreductase